MSTILIVDADPAVATAGRQLLEQEGHTVSQARTYSEGMRAVADLSPDLVICEVMMEEPDDGLRFARALRRLGRSAPILMLTNVNAAMGLQIDRDEEVVPVDAFEDKPIDPNHLVATVTRLLAACDECH